MSNSNSALSGNRGLVVAVLLSVVLFNVPWGRYLVYPFALLSTWFHEMGHGMMATLLGCDFRRLVLNPDTSGYAVYSYSDALGTVGRATIASSGYLGTAVAGFLWLALRRFPRAARACLTTLALTLLVTVVWVVLHWPGDGDPPPTTGPYTLAPLWLPFFGASVAGAWAAFLLWTVTRGPLWLVHFVYHLIAVQTALNAVLDVRGLYMVSGASDAHTLSELLLLPAAVWATLWLIAGILLTGAGLWLGHSPGDTLASTSKGRGTV